MSNLVRNSSDFVASEVVSTVAMIWANLEADSKNMSDACLKVRPRESSIFTKVMFRLASPLLSWTSLHTLYASSTKSASWEVAEVKTGCSL